MSDERTTYYELFNEYEQVSEGPPSPAYLEMEARLAGLSKESESVIREFNSILGPPGKGRRITLPLCERFASAVTRIDKRVVLAVGAYCELREGYLSRDEQPPEYLEVLKTVLFMAWCRIRERDEGSPPTNDFYEFFFAYKDAVLEIGMAAESYILWLNLQRQSDRSWWGGAKPVYAKTLQLIGDAFMLATVDYAIE